MTEEQNFDKQLTIEKYNKLLLNIGTTLLSTGAHCGRINRNVNRIASVLGVETEILFSYSGLMMNTHFKDEPTYAATHYKRVIHHKVHFGILAEMSLLSWRAKNKNYTYEQIAEEFEAVEALPEHPRWQILLGVSVACACLCLLSGGNFTDISFAFVATLAGMFTKQEIARRKFNIMIVNSAAAFVTSMIAATNVYFHLGANPEAALSTAVLYLVPGVPLVNSVIDLIEGHFSTSIARGFYGGFILLCIAIGMSISVLIFGIHNF